MLWTLCAVASALLGARLWSRRRLARTASWRLEALVFALLIVACGVFAPSVMLLKKFVAKLVMPAGLVACGLTLVAVRSWRRGRWRERALSLTVLLAYVALSNEWLASALTVRLERDYAAIDPFDSGTFDAIVVLGGGTGLTPRGGPELGSAGDRVALGAELYRAGITRTLVTSGASIAGLDVARDLSWETETVWRRLGVPQEAIVRVEGPRNTAEEAEAYRALITARGWRRVGLVTSGTHMRRALLQTRQRGLTLLPLPADLRGRTPQLSAPAMVPDAQAFLTMQQGLWEVLGGALVR